VDTASDPHTVSQPNDLSLGVQHNVKLRPLAKSYDAHSPLRGSSLSKLLACEQDFPYGLQPKISPQGETIMAYSLYDAAVTPCAQQLGALIGIIDKAAAHCAANKIEESALLQDRLYPDMFCLARQIRQSADFAMNTGGRLAGVTPPALPAVDDTSFAAAKSRVETALGFVKSLTREQVDGGENKVIAWKGGANDRKMKGTDYLQQFALPNFFFFVTTAYDILRHRGVPLGKRDFLGPVNWL
ncbi:MAG TPA: DUF1993 domain-containing protein, partial [Stellaceae bacterium]|nr:DUF1993 domain-containing protein [Stellaceae bacterium]